MKKNSQEFELVRYDIKLTKLINGELYFTYSYNEELKSFKDIRNWLRNNLDNNNKTEINISADYYNKKLDHSMEVYRTTIYVNTNMGDWSNEMKCVI